MKEGEEKEIIGKAEKMDEWVIQVKSSRWFQGRLNTLSVLVIDAMRRYPIPKNRFYAQNERRHLFSWRADDFDSRFWFWFWFRFRCVSLQAQPIQSHQDGMLRLQEHITSQHNTIQHLSAQAFDDRPTRNNNSSRNDDDVTKQCNKTTLSLALPLNHQHQTQQRIVQ